MFIKHPIFPICVTVEERETLYQRETLSINTKRHDAKVFETFENRSTLLAYKLYDIR